MEAIDLEAISLLSGSHKTREDGMCALEAVAWLAGEPHTDHPQCACPVIAGFLRNWNDSLPSDAERGRLLKPLLPLLLNTRGGDKLLLRRMYLALDWEIRVMAPAWLRLAGLVEHADAMAALAEVCDEASLQAAARVSSAAYSAAVSAADSAARSAAYSAAYSAADSAAVSAADSAARERLAPTVAALQESASDLVRRMCALTEADVAEWHWSASA
jgi:hypothetical protein